MNWFFRTFASSIGKKLVMAATGLLFCLFLAVHLLGNLTIYGGARALNTYSERLHSLGIVITAAEWGLVVCAAFHVCLAALLYYQNWRARPVGYVMKKSAGGRTFSSATMPYTGLYMLVFVIIHLVNFHFADRSQQTLYEIVSGMLSNPWYAAYYAFSMVVAAFHVRHGLWSAFQSLGANHPKYMPFVRRASLAFGLVVAVGFGSIPIVLLAWA